MEIKKVSIIGLGALGTMFGHHLLKRMPRDGLRIIADSARKEKYRREGVFCNGELCDFNYFSPEEKAIPADLLIFAVKYNDLDRAIGAAANHVGPGTVIMSLLNGISSEEAIGSVLGMDKMIFTVAQGMDAVKEGNRTSYGHMGMLCFGAVSQDGRDEKVDSTARFFEATALPHEVVEDMRGRLWGKLMLNVGVNQAAAVFGCGYGGLQAEGTAREVMISAMREVMALSQKEGVNLTEAELGYWLNILGTLNPGGKPSMQQDIEAGRLSEVELFAGTVLKLGRRHGIPVPTNRMLYEKIRQAEGRGD